MAEDLVKFGLYLCSGTKPFTIHSEHRIIWFSKEENLATLIRTDTKVLHKPKTYPYSIVRDWIEEKKIIRISKETVVPQLMLSDSQLAKRYPPKETKNNSKDSSKKLISAPLRYRQQWLPLINEVKVFLNDVWREKNRSLSSILESACKKYNLPLNESYQVLYRFLANKNSELSVIPLRFHCGGPNKKRAGKGYALGRRTNEVRKKNGKNTNFKLTQKWLQRISDTYQETIARGVTSGDAYSTFLNLYCIVSAERINRDTKIKYLPIGSRPSKSQFLQHGPDGDPEQELWRKQLVEQEYEKNYRPLDGHTEPVTLRTGVSAHVDASSNDRYLVSVFDAAQTIGTARFIPVVDQDIGYIWGFYSGFRVNKEAARLAILDAATDKVAKCARYGITIEPGEWYSHVAAEYVADRGEFNCDPVRDSLDLLNASIEYTATGRADLRGRGERTHGLLHEHNANGSTFGKFRTRGERDPALDADQNIFQYSRELIRRVLLHNNFAPVPDLLTTEMRQAGVRPTRRDILEYSMKMGYHHRLSYNEDDLILALAPEYDAVVTRDGVYPIVQRDIDSGDEIILDELRYLGPFVESERWLERVRKTDRRFRIKVRLNPSDPSSIWYQDPDTGLHRLDLATTDPLIKRLATIQDLTLRKTEDAISLNDVANAAQEEQARIQLQNNAERRAIAQKKSKAILEGTGKKGKSSNATGRRAAMQQEVGALGQSPVPILSRTPVTAPTADDSQDPRTTPNNVIPLRASPPSDLDDAFDRWLNGDAL